VHLSKIFLELLSDLTVVDQVILALIGELITQTSTVVMVSRHCMLPAWTRHH
jgi:hypothetical protein